MEKTTLQKARQQSHEDLVNNLQGILEKNYDAEAGYKEAMTKAENGFLTTYLQNKAVTRSHFATEITDLIIGLNETPKEAGSTKGAIHRTWMNIKDAFTSNTDEGILEECIRGEKASVEEYKEFLVDTTLPREITSIITNQMLKVEESLAQVKKIEDLIS
jgi:uncharacterized protein (TIGR02284 family)